MATLRQLLSNQNHFKNRTIAINLRNVGQKVYIFGLTLNELVGFSVGGFGMFYIFGNLGFLISLGCWLWTATYRLVLKRGYFIRKIYSKYSRRTYSVASEHMPYFGDFIAKT